MTKEQVRILSKYTDDLDSVETMTHHDYVMADGKKISQLLDDYHILWFHDDPGNMYLVERKDPR